MSDKGVTQEVAVSSHDPQTEFGGTGESSTARGSV